MYNSYNIVLFERDLLSQMRKNKTYIFPVWIIENTKPRWVFLLYYEIFDQTF